MPHECGETLQPAASSHCWWQTMLSKMHVWQGVRVPTLATAATERQTIAEVDVSQHRRSTVAATVTGRLRYVEASDRWWPATQTAGSEWYGEGGSLSPALRRNCRKFQLSVVVATMAGCFSFIPFWLWTTSLPTR
ncbi:unnamed protein product [Ceratitis capitata]|uniref:(Mediterranean fruit fly) hypothetical protein n=1 Tax=Ceratitis capitata TaxID=7213 RepID=A0A811UN43_CERCA|nr:unnamed protein product [Ceratitis capitata]